MIRAAPPLGLPSIRTSHPRNVLNRWSYGPEGNLGQKGYCRALLAGVI